MKQRKKMGFNFLRTREVEISETSKFDIGYVMSNLT